MYTVTMKNVHRGRHRNFLAETVPDQNQNQNGGKKILWQKAD